MSFLHKQINFIASLKKKLIAALAVGVFLSFIIIFLEPFDTNQYESKNRTFNLLGFGFLLSLVFLIQSLFENFWYAKRNKFWTVFSEIIATFIFFFIAGTVIFFYNHFYINDREYNFKSHWWYYKSIVLFMIPVIAPVLVYLRQQLGERIIPRDKESLTITGLNKNETLMMRKNELFYIKSIENYIEIYYLDSGKKLASTTYRQSLTNVMKQVAFIEKCHRSYLVNIDQIKEVEGNSQSAKITFRHIDHKIPLSKTLFKTISEKINLSVRQN